MTRIGFVGAGAGTAAAAFVIGGTLPDADLTVLEKSGGVCGRAATRRRGDVTYDYGANYLKNDDERVTDLVTAALDGEDLVDVTEPIYTFDEDGQVSEGRDADDHKWTYPGGITGIAKRLFARTDATVHRNTRIETIRRDGEDWRLEDTAGGHWGPFDALVVNPPAPQTATLLAGADWDAPIRHHLVDAVDDVPFRTIWTAVLGYEFELDVPYYALVNVDKSHEIGWIAREECKTGHVPDGQSVLIVQANHEWSVDRYDDDPAATVSTLATLTADVLDDDRLADPEWTDHQRWRYALPEDGVARGPIDTAAREHDLYAVGDWVEGEGRLHAALRSGLDTGERIVHAL